MTAKENKLAVIRGILKNPTYLPESGLYKKLFTALLHLSLDDLTSLRLFIEEKKYGQET